jgi:hypothetical protein
MADVIDTIQDDQRSSSTLEGEAAQIFKTRVLKSRPAEPNESSFLAGHSFFLPPLWPRLPPSPGGFMPGISRRRMMLKSTATSTLFPAGSAAPYDTSIHKLKTISTSSQGPF